MRLQLHPVGWSFHGLDKLSFSWASGLVHLSYTEDKRVRILTQRRQGPHGASWVFAIDLFFLPRSLEAGVVDGLVGRIRT